MEGVSISTAFRPGPGTVGMAHGTPGVLAEQLWVF